MQYLNKQNKNGFTLIEVMVTLAVLAMALPLLFTILVSVLRVQLRVSRLTQIKQEGDHVINIIETNIKNNAYDLSQTVPVNGLYTKACDPTSVGNTYSGALYLIDKSKNAFTYTLSGVKIVQSVAGVTKDLTSSNSKITNFVFYCYRTSAFSSPVVEVSFDITFNTVSTDPIDVASLRYQTRVKLRNSLDFVNY